MKSVNFSKNLRKVQKLKIFLIIKVLQQNLMIP